ncbi:hypothetical protein FM042_02590 [Aliidiomarina halalkaliphila]|uniref:DUF975 domain-containing protein n=1 Tax=Aliidiomarina halalkaliphila TaxID=2593535 RepID=A0A552X415_9GAMM|nr:hypothetical protein [Aliidiomarina halalkaliphila]TRW49764.1 hypothetical protein FM042_02590 [Aliidiomarina halalkaliphila]
MQEKLRGSYQHASTFAGKLDINRIIKTAYEHVKSRRGPFLGAMGWTVLLLFVAMIFVAILAEVIGVDVNEGVGQILSVAIQTLILAPCVAGLYWVSLKTTLHIKSNREDFFLFFQNPWRIIGTAIITALVSQLGLLFGMAVGIIWMMFAQILFTFAIPMAALYQAKPFAAVLGSAQIIWKNIGAFFIFHFVMFVLYLLIAVAATILVAFATAGGAGVYAAVVGGLVLTYVLFTRVIPLYFFTIAESYRILFAVSTDEDDTSNSTFTNNPVVDPEPDQSSDADDSLSRPNRDDDFRA